MANPDRLLRGLGLTPPGDRSAETRAHLAEAIPRLAHAIDIGEVEPILEDLRIIAGLCDDYQLPEEAARIRRWMGDTTS